MINKHKDIPWLPDEDYQKAVTQLKLQIGAVLESCFHMYGLDAYIPGAITEITKLCEDFGLRVRGVDHPISIEIIRRQYGK